MSETQLPESPSTGRWLPTWKGGLVIALPWLVMLWVRLADPIGDRGSVNVFQFSCWSVWASCSG